MKHTFLSSFASLLLLSASTFASPILNHSNSEESTQATSSSILATRRFPPSPSGARFEQFKPCDSSSQTIPIFVNSAWTTDSGKASDVTHAFIVQHGALRDFNGSFLDVSKTIGTGRVLVSPAFYIESDSQTQDNWYQPSLNLAWKKDASWAGGYDATDAQCSSYDVYDALTTNFLRKDLYPKLKKLTYIGHSEGGAFVSRYALISEETSELTIRYVEANTPSHAYSTNNRPSDESCDGYDNWGYGVASNLPRYVADHFSDPTSNFKRYVTRDVISLVGNLDTYKNYPFGDVSCKATIQGNKNRRERNYAYWAYKNLLAGTNTDVSDYYGYDELKKSHGGVKSVNAKNFNHRNCIVANVGHDAHGIFSSDCGRASLFNSELPKGASP